MLFRSHKRQDRLIVRTGTGEGDHEKAAQQRHEGLGRHIGPTQEDTSYIRTVFGQSILTEHELRILENDLCAGIDEGCRLWVSRGAGVDEGYRLWVSRGAGVDESYLLWVSRGAGVDENHPSSAGKTASKSISASKNKTAYESKSVSESKTASDGKSVSEKEDILKQIARNKVYFENHAAEIRHSIKDLSTRVDTVLSSYLTRLRSGKTKADFSRFSIHAFEIGRAHV